MARDTHDWSNLLIGSARKTGCRAESQSEMDFSKNFGDPGHSRKSMGLSEKKAGLVLDANSGADKKSRSPRSESAGSSDPTANFHSSKISTSQR